jgi:hypothetical protein
MDRDERIAASRVVYSLGVSTFMLVSVTEFKLYSSDMLLLGSASTILDRKAHRRFHGPHFQGRGHSVDPEWTGSERALRLSEGKCRSSCYST